MDKMDLIKCGIRTAAKCTGKQGVPAVLKTICADFIPSLIDFVADARLVKDRHDNETVDEGFDPFEPQESDIPANMDNKQIDKMEV